MGGLVPCPLELVEEVLSPVEGGPTKRILDVGKSGPFLSLTF